MNSKGIKNLTYPAKTGYLAALFTVFLALVTFLIFLPTVKKVKSLRSEIISQKIEMENRLNRQQNMSEVASKIKLIEPQLPVLSRSYINKNRELEFITTLEGIAAEHGLEQTMNLDPASGKVQGNYRVVPLNLILRGTYDDILSYLIAIETGPYYINISTLSFSANRGSGRGTADLAVPPLSETALNATINATTFWK